MRGVRGVCDGLGRGRTVIDQLVAGFLAGDEGGDHIGGLVHGVFDCAV